MTYIIGFNFVTIVGLLGFIVYIIINDRDSYLLTIPGLKNARVYQKYISERNNLVSQNNVLYSENDDLFEEASQALDPDFGMKLANISLLNQNIIKISNNYESLRRLDEDAVNIDFPDNIKNRIDEWYREDLHLKQDTDLYLNYLYAQEDYLTLRSNKDLLDNCFLNIEYTEDPKVVSDNILVCVVRYDSFREQLAEIENSYGVSLTIVNNYIESEYTQWDSLRRFYDAVANGDYQKEKEYDDLYNSSRKKLNDIDRTTIWIEFKEEVLDVIEEGIEGF